MSSSPWHPIPDTRWPLVDGETYYIRLAAGFPFAAIWNAASATFTDDVFGLNLNIPWFEVFAFRSAV